MTVRRIRRGLAAGAVAGVFSGAPSTLHALVTGRDPLAAAEAAGNLLLPAASSRTRLLLAGAAAHAALSLAWGSVLAVALPRHRTGVAWGAAAGLAIAALDLGVVGRRFPLIRALPAGPQVADHLAFGAVAGAVLGR